MLTRRFLLRSGGCAASFALATAAYRAWDRGVWSGGEGPAYAPWRDWQGSDGDGAKRPLRAAILAANPHNTQPWTFDVRDNVITVLADRARNLGSFDPFRREMHLGLGAALENLVLAAAGFGFTATLETVGGRLSAAADDTPVAIARVRLALAAVTQGPRFLAISQRHTNRGPYRADQSVDPATLRGLTDLVAGERLRVAFVAERRARAELGAIIVDATGRIVGDPQMSADSARWFRTGSREIAAHCDGVTVDAAGVSPVMAAVTKLLPDLDAASADRYWLAMTRETQVPTAPVLGLILVPDRLDMRSAIEAGRAWQRLHLAATVAGLAAQPLNQPVECIDRDAMLGQADHYGPALAEFGRMPGWEPTFVFRLGIAEYPAGASPRRPLRNVLRTQRA